MSLVIQIGADVRQAVKGVQDVSLTLKDQREILKSLQLQYARLNTEQARGKIGRELAADIKIAKDEVSRLAVTSTNAFGAVGKGATAAFGAIRQMAYVLPGIGIAGILGGLSDLVIGLFRSSDAFSSAELSAARFDQAIRSSKEGLEQYAAALDFTADIDKLRAKLDAGFGPGADARGDLAGFGIDVKKNNQLIKDLDVVNADLVSRISNIRTNAQLFLGESARKLIDEFHASEIPDNLITKLKGRDEEIVREYKGFALKLQDNREAQRKASKENDTIELNAQLRQAQEQKRIRDEAIREYEEYVNKTISRGKALASFFEGRRVVPNFTIFDSKEESFKKAQQLIADFEQKKIGDFEPQELKIIFRPKIEIQPVLVRTPETFTAIKKSVLEIEKEIDKFRTTDIPDLKLNISASVTSTLAENNKAIKVMADDLRALAELGRYVGNTLADGFSTVFDAIASGENILKAFGEAIKQIVVDLIQAAIRALIVRSITNLFAPGLGGATGGVGSLFGALSFRASGGPVAGGTPYVTGERGPELFIPSTSGRIIPNNQLSGIQGSAMQMIRVEVAGKLALREIVLGVARELKYQNNNA